MHPHTSSMDQRIFTAGLPTAVVSCYLLCCGLHDAGRRITRQNLSAIWNSDAAALEHALESLEACNIIQRTTPANPEPTFRLLPADRWQNPPPSAPG